MWWNEGFRENARGVLGEAELSPGFLSLLEEGKTASSWDPGQHSQTIEQHYRGLNWRVPASQCSLTLQMASLPPPKPADCFSGHEPDVLEKALVSALWEDRPGLLRCHVLGSLHWADSGPTWFLKSSARQSELLRAPCGRMEKNA